MNAQKFTEIEKLTNESEIHEIEMKSRMDFLASLGEEMFEVLAPLANNEVERRMQKSIADYYAVCIYNGSRYFVQISRNVEDIANAIRMPLDKVFWFARLPAWKEAVRFWGYTGDPAPLVDLSLSRNVPEPLRETYLIQEVFQKYSNVRFVTYTGFRDTIVKKVSKYAFILDDGSQLEKINVILAFPADRMYYVKKGIKRRKRVADLGLDPIVSIKDRRKINVVARIGCSIECVMRNGLVVTGENIWISKYNIVMRVGGKKSEGGKVVLLYRHALYDFKVIWKQPDPQTVSDQDFDDETKVSETSDFQEEK